MAVAAYAAYDNAFLSSLIYLIASMGNVDIASQTGTYAYASHSGGRYGQGTVLVEVQISML